MGSLRYLLTGGAGARGAGTAPDPGDPQNMSLFLGYAGRLEVVVADNTPLAQLTDMTGNARHAAQATGSKQWLYRTNDVNGLPGFQCDGTDDGYQVSIDLSHTPAITIFGVVKPTASASFRALVELGADYSAAQTRFLVQHENNNTIGAYLVGNVGSVSVAHDVNWSGAAHYFAVIMDKSKAIHEITSYVDGILTTGTLPNTNNTNAFGIETLNIGSRNNGASRVWLGRVEELWLADWRMTPQELSDYGAFVNSLYGLSYGIYTPITSDVIGDDYYGSHPRNPGHHVYLETTATRLSWVVSTDLFSVGLGTEAEGTLRQSNWDHFVGNLNNDTVDHEFAVSNLPSGSKQVEIVSGLTARPSDAGAVKGVRLLGVVVPSTATTTFVQPNTGGLTVIYGDSISVGDDASSSSIHGWNQRFRREMVFDGNRVRFEGWGSRTFYNDANDAAARATFVPKLTSGNPSRIILAIGVNDYSFTRPTVLPSAWNASAGQTAMAAVLDDINAALPDADVVIITPIGRAVESAVNGNTLGAWRTAWVNAASGKSWVTVIDGTTILNYSTETAEYEGPGTHPSNQGMVTYFARVMRALDLGIYQYDSLIGRWSAMEVMTTTLTLADAGAIARVDDSAGRRNHATQGTAGAQPKFWTNQTPAKGPAIRVDGGDGLATAAIDLTGSTGLTVYAVAKFASGDTGYLCELGADHTAIATGFAVKHNADNTITASLVGDAGTSDFTTTGTVTAYALITAVFDKSLATNEVTVYLNGVSAGTRTNNSDNGNAFGNLALNLLARNNAASGQMASTGELADLVLSNTADGDSQRQAIEQALCARHGINWAG